MPSTTDSLREEDKRTHASTSRASPAGDADVGLGTMKKLGITTLALAVCALVVGVVVPLVQGPPIMDFVNHWGTLFAQCNSTNDLAQLPEIEQPDLVFTFDNGEWVAVASEYACGSGAGFNATVFGDSNDDVMYQTNHHFCGFEGLSAELGKSEGTSIVDFYAALPEDLELKEWKGPEGQQLSGAVADKLRSTD